MPLGSEVSRPERLGNPLEWLRGLPATAPSHPPHLIVKTNNAAESQQLNRKPNTHTCLVVGPGFSLALTFLAFPLAFLLSFLAFLLPSLCFWGKAVENFILNEKVFQLHQRK